MMQIIQCAGFAGLIHLNQARALACDAWLETGQGAKTSQNAHSHDPGHRPLGMAGTSFERTAMSSPRNNVPASAPAEPEFLSRGEVARLFGVSASTVTRWARTGLLKAVRTPGGHYRFHAEDMRRAARSGTLDELVRLD
jgi:excisionase family DNA binding protein